MEAYERLAGSDSPIEALSASNAAEAATTLAAVADMMLKMGEEEEASRSLTTSLDLLKQHPGQLPALQVGPRLSSIIICLFHPTACLWLHETLVEIQQTLLCSCFCFLHNPARVLLQEGHTYKECNDLRNG